ncbi:hypothetical protein CHS0354_012995 [Potamilus streckersoni]|uniref:Uncharacterized protein n=1 Tax=Potamilus streckersoni TaxID=2493646 RepID=A0AAE0T7P5_9BIVA|nr:hypothetical protein CHS0354_012995 [Potamilus streckersoni]
MRACLIFAAVILLSVVHGTDSLPREMQTSRERMRQTDRQTDKLKIKEVSASDGTIKHLMKRRRTNEKSDLKGITEGQPGACNKRIYFCFVNPCQTRANTCRDPRDCRPDYCGGCKTKCVTTTPVPKQAIVGTTTRHPPFSAGRSDYCAGCKAKCGTTVAVSERARSQTRFYYCGGCKTKCVTTTPVPELAMLQTRAYGLPLSTRRPDFLCGCKTKYVTRSPTLGRALVRLQRPCGACSSSRQT